MTDLELCFLPATEVLARFRSGTLSPVEYLDALIARAEAVNPKVNAFAFTHFDKARDAAARAEARYARGAADLGPLEGLPVAIKDELEIEGEIVTNGSLYLKDNRCSESHILAQRLFDAGACYHGQTTTPEFSCAGVTDSRIHGTTRTPWDLRYTCGGSSGGSGVALATGMAPLATGSDIGGSIRIPAACCGVLGFKPPYGRNPNSTALGYDMYHVIGPMARSIDDLILMQNVFSGPHPFDNAAIRPRYELPATYDDLKGVKIAWSMDLGFYETDDHVRRNTGALLGLLEELGAELVEVGPLWDARAERAVECYLDHGFGGFIARAVATDPSLASPWGKACAEANARWSAVDFCETLEVQRDVGRRFGTLLEECDAFICPTLGHHEIPADQRPGDRLTVNGREVDPMYGWTLCHPFNMMGRCPVLAVPSGLGDNGLPTSVQIVARPFDDARVFRVGKALEAAGAWQAVSDARARLPL